MTRALPPETNREPQTKFEDTFSAEDVLLETFFPEEADQKRIKLQARMSVFARAAIAKASDK